MLTNRDRVTQSNVALDSVVVLITDSFDTIIVLGSNVSLANGGDMSRVQLAGMLRQVQWAADEGAFNIGAGRFTPEQQRELAQYLAYVASALTADLEAMSPTVIDAQRLDNRLPGGADGA